MVFFVCYFGRNFNYLFIGTDITMMKLIKASLVVLFVLFMPMITIAIYDHFTKVTNNDLIGNYKFEFQDENYFIKLDENNKFTYYQFKNNKIVTKDSGYWEIGYSGLYPYLKIETKKICGTCFATGYIKKSIFNNQIKIEILSEGKFHGSEDDAFMAKETN